MRPSGEIRHVEGRGACEFNSDGEVVAIFGTVLDSSERKNAEIALAESEHRFRLLAENSTDIIACFEPDGTSTFLSQATRQFPVSNPMS